jgi:tetratricopeptide (TPR) repeat protein
MSQDRFDEAIRLEDAGLNEQALEVWRQLAETHPRHTVFLRMARVAWDLERFDEAEAGFKRALEIKRDLVLALVPLGTLAIRRADWESAVDYLKRACAIEEDARAFCLLGVALRNFGKEVEAEEAHRAAIRIDPNYEEAYYNLGVVLKFERPSEAELLFLKALELDPDFAAAHRELGFVLMGRDGASPEVGEHLRRALELAPGDAWAHIYIGNYLWASSQPDTALEEFRTASKLQPNWAVALICQGDIYQDAHKDFGQAQSLLEEALRLEPDCEMALWSMARLSKKRGQLDVAKDYASRVLVLDPSHKRALALLAEIGRVQ